MKDRMPSNPLKIEDRRVPSRRFWNMPHVSELNIWIKISKKFLEAALETNNYGWSKDTNGEVTKTGQALLEVIKVCGNYSTLEVLCKIRYYAR